MSETPELDSPGDVAATMPPRMVFDSPCDADLDSMPSFDGGRRRFCAECMRSVHMLSEMTRPEAQSFIERNGGECMSYRRGEDGRLVFRAEPPPMLLPSASLTRRSAARRLEYAAPMLAALAGCSSPVETPATIEDESADLEVDTEAAYAGYAAVPDQQEPCEPPPVTQIEVPARKRGNNESLLANNQLAVIGQPGHYAGGIGASDIILAEDVSLGISNMQVASVEAKGIDQAVLEGIVRKQTSQLRSCLESERVDRGASELALKFVIDATGQVLSSRARYDTGKSVSCEGVVGGWQFPEPEGPSATVTVRYSFDLDRRVSASIL